jgi:7-cyano-7-deazaguanine tRNA-ribosyltransferase
MTETGTSRLEKLEYFPCTCPKCTRANPKQVLEFPQKERETFLAEHNLYTCAAELKRIKQAIKDGRLWEHLELRAHGHPSLLQAVRRLKEHKDFIEKHDPSVKNSGLFYFDSAGLIRPEIIRHRRKLATGYSSPKETKILLLAPQTRTKPFHKSKPFRELSNRLQHKFKEKAGKIHACFYAAPFGIVPIELDEVYPLSQHEIAVPLDLETVETVADQLTDYINRVNYEMVILLNDSENWGKTILNTCKKACLKKNVKLESINMKEDGNRTVLAKLEKILQEI